MRRKLSVILAVLAIASMIAVPVSAQTGAPQAQPGRQAPAGLQPVTGADLDGPFAGSTYVPSKQRMTATARYVVRLADAPLAEQWLDAQQRGAAFDAAAAQAYTDALLAKQAQVSDAVTALGGKTLANFTKLVNGIAIEISGIQVRDLYFIPGVVAVNTLPDYALDLNDTVPWIGASDVQAMGVDGSGITVAVIDSGIDYTHRHMAGCGTQECTDQALAEASQPADPALYPTAKVIGGYDFVGSSWPNTAEIPDPNPMDDEAGGVDGHGTHVASIIGGVAVPDDNIGPGVAPGVEFYALKVCSSVSTSCSGLALLQAYEWAADPNGDLNFDDRADVVNLSLGSVYGQPSSADSDAMGMLVDLGTTVSASAGNSGNMPYISGAPSSARAAISVAQTSVPSAILYRIRRNTPDPVTIMDAVWQPWSEFPTTAITGDVVYGNGDGTNLDGCAAFTADLTGKVSIVNRGSCNFSLKTQNAEAAGATMSIIALIAPGDPFEGGFGGGPFPGIPAFMVSQANGNLLKATGANITIDPNDPAITIPLLDVIVGSSSRGPAFDLSYIKPNIGAPGASYSASSGDQSYSVFGGTSGASPMVAGSAALLLDKAGGSGSLAPVVVKALLMNNAVTDTWQNFPGGMLNPITRQGAGRVDVLAASEAETIAWVPADDDVALSFGFETVADDYADSKTVEVINTAAADKTYSIEAGFRYANDEDAGVDVMLSADTLTVPAGGTGTFDVDMHVDPTMLKAWPFTSGSTFANGDLLTGIEVDGFVTLTANDGEVINLPWQFLPRQSADVMVGDPAQTGPYSFDVPLTNDSMVDGSVEVYPLVDMSPEIVLPPGTLDEAPADLKYVGVDGIRWNATSNLLLFPINSWNSRSTPINVEYDVYIDVDQDGIDDYIAYNGQVNGTTDPRAVSVLVDLAAGTATLQFYLDTTINTDNMVIPVIVPDDDMAFNFQVYAFDAYFTGALWDTSPADALDGAYHMFNAALPAFYPDEYYPEVPAGGDASSTVMGQVNDSPAQIGMYYRVVNGVMGGEVYGVELPVEIFGDVSQTASTSPVVPGTYIDVDVSASNSGDAIADGLFLAPIDPDTLYVDGSAYGGAYPLMAAYAAQLAAEKGLPNLAAAAEGRAADDVVAVAWSGPFNTGEIVDFGFQVQVMTSSGTVQHSVALFDGATYVASFGSDALAIVDNSTYPVSRSRRFNAARDTYINGAQPGSFYGDAQTMWTGFFGQMRPLVQTSISGIPSDAYVDVAYLYLYIVEGRGFTNWSNSVINVEAHQVTGNWMPVAVNWTMPWTMPGGDYGPAIGSNHIGSGKLNTWLRLDVTDAVTDFLRGASNQGFIITNSDSTGVRYALATKEFWDASKAGYLRVYFRTAN